MNSRETILQNLIDFGLGEKEAKIYLALLELEIGTVGEASEIAGINRSSAYVTIETLKEKGLVSVSYDKKIQQYVATPPEALLRSAERLSKRQEDLKNKIAEIVPQLKALNKNTKQKPQIMVFEGKQSLFNLSKEIISNDDKTVRSTLSTEEFSKIGIEKVKTINSKLAKQPADLIISGNKTGFITTKDGAWAVVIENKDVAETMKNLFDLASWFQTFNATS